MKRITSQKEEKRKEEKTFRNLDKSGVFLDRLSSSVMPAPDALITAPISGGGDAKKNVSGWSSTPL
ncbi:MAG: hypothetical protein OHK0047_26940 [Leptolyngbyaceae cyanobacterium]